MFAPDFYKPNTPVETKLSVRPGSCPRMGATYSVLLPSITHPCTVCDQETPAKLGVTDNFVISLGEAM